jgi:glycosyltransferase involved in cell wall biosynthesis
VVDGGSDDSRQVAEQAGARVLRLPTAGGPARARNLGAREAGGDIVWFVDADVTIPPEGVGRVAAAFASEPEVDALFGSYDDRPSEANFLSQYKNLLHHYVRQTSAEEAWTFWSGCGAVRRETFLSLGGFDESYRRPCIEDIELGYRLRAAGHRIRLLKGLQVKHWKRWGVVSLVKADFFDRALPWTELILARGTAENDLNLKTSSRVSVVLAWLLLPALLGTLAAPAVWPAAASLGAALLALNRDLYRFFWRQRGPLFAAGLVPWHWLYFWYSGLAFAIGTLRFRAGSRRRRPGGLAGDPSKGAAHGG